ncbi:MAG: trehalose-phosphatase [Pararhizobium sp.]
MHHEQPPAPDPDGDALFLDFDGTLVGFADDPEAVDVPARLISTLRALATRFGGALALVSGRAIVSIDNHLAPLRLPIAGVHGLEFRRADEIRSNAAEAQRLEPARRRIAALLPPGDAIRIEDKGGAIVLHFRGAPDMAGRAREIADAAAAEDAGLVAVGGHAIVEVRPRAITKAGAIRAFMDEPPFAGRRPVFVGDDVTDEDGFAAVAALGGYGIKVGPGETGARHRLADVAAVHDWLCRAVSS